MVLDLLTDPAPAFGVDSMNAYKKRNYMAQGLSPAEATLLKPHDRMIAQLKASDRVVMPYPMHNFGIPGPVKT